MTEEDDLLKRMGQHVRTSGQDDWERLERFDDRTGDDVADLAGRSPAWAQLVQASSPPDADLRNDAVTAVLKYRQRHQIHDDRSWSPAATWIRWRIQLMIAAVSVAAATAIALSWMPRPGPAPLPSYDVFINGSVAAVMVIPKDRQGAIIAAPRTPGVIELRPHVPHQEEVALLVSVHTTSGWRSIEATHDIAASGSIRVRLFDYRVLKGADRLRLTVARRNVAGRKHRDLCAETDCLHREVQIR